MLPIRVQGASMLPTYKDGVNFINRLAYVSHQPRRGDLDAALDMAYGYPYQARMDHRLVPSQAVMVLRAIVKTANECFDCLWLVTFRLVFRAKLERHDARE